MPVKSMRIIFIIILTIYQSLAQFSIDGELTITLADSTVQTQTDYTFTIILILNDPVLAGSFIQIVFPSDYAS